MFRKGGRSDYTINSFAFLLYAIALQLVVMPTIAAHSDATAFALVVLFFAVYSVLANAAGEELGNAFLIRQQAYLTAKVRPQGDALLLLVPAVTVAVVLGSWFIVMMGWSIHRLPIFVLAVILGIGRTLYLSVLRARRSFDKILISQAVYLGASTTMALQFEAFSEPVYIFVVADAAAILSAAPFLVQARPRRLGPTPLFRGTYRVYRNFAGSALLVNSIDYMDRILVLPLLGAQAMGAYYATSSMSKMVALPLGPLSGVILSRMGHLAERDGPQRARSALKSMLPIMVITFVVAAGAGFVGVTILYPQFLDDLRLLLIPISIATAAGGAVSITRPTLMRFLSSGRLVQINLVYVATLVLGCVMLLPLGLVGFSWAIAVARLIQAGGFAIALKLISGRASRG